MRSQSLRGRLRTGGDKKVFCTATSASVHYDIELITLIAAALRRQLILKLMRYIKFFLALTTVIANVNAAEFSSTQDGLVINMVGEIAEGDRAKFLQVMTSHSKVIKVQNGGGVTDEAMQLGRLIHDRNFDLEVDKFCMSSCTHYLFPAAIKTIPKGNILGLHGTVQLTEATGIQETKDQLAMAGIPEGDIDKELQGYLQTFRKQALLERVYAQYLGIDNSFYTDYRRVLEASSALKEKFSGLNVSPLWWPSAARFERCYHIPNVVEHLRPIELDTEGYKLDTVLKVISLEDISLNECQ